MNDRRFGLLEMLLAIARNYVKGCSREEFAGRADKFIKNEIPPESFLALCDFLSTMRVPCAPPASRLKDMRSGRSLIGKTMPRTTPWPT